MPIPRLTCNHMKVGNKYAEIDSVIYIFASARSVRSDAMRHSVTKFVSAKSSQRGAATG
jgi:hypothetical protein